MIEPYSGMYVSGEVPIQYNLSSNAEGSIIKYNNGSGEWVELGRSNETRVTFSWNTTAFEEGISVICITARNWRNDVAQKI